MRDGLLFPPRLVLGCIASGRRRHIIRHDRGGEVTIRGLVKIDIPGRRLFSTTFVEKRMVGERRTIRHRTRRLVTQLRLFTFRFGVHVWKCILPPQTGRSLCRCHASPGDRPGLFCGTVRPFQNEKPRPGKVRSHRGVHRKTPGWSWVSGQSHGSRETERDLF